MHNLIYCMNFTKKKKTEIGLISCFGQIDWQSETQHYLCRFKWNIMGMVQQQNAIIQTNCSHLNYLCEFSVWLAAYASTLHFMLAHASSMCAWHPYRLPKTFTAPDISISTLHSSISKYLTENSIIYYSLTGMSRRLKTLQTTTNLAQNIYLYSSIGNISTSKLHLSFILSHSLIGFQQIWMRDDTTRNGGGSAHLRNVFFFCFFFFFGSHIHSSTVYVTYTHSQNCLYSQSLAIYLTRRLLY